MLSDLIIIVSARSVTFFLKKNPTFVATCRNYYYSDKLFGFKVSAYMITVLSAYNIMFLRVKTMN